MWLKIKENLKTNMPDDQAVIKIIEEKKFDSFLLSMLTLMKWQDK